jgi:hypothetical protein
LRLRPRHHVSRGPECISEGPPRQCRPNAWDLVGVELLDSAELLGQPFLLPAHFSSTSCQFPKDPVVHGPVFHRLLGGKGTAWGFPRALRRSRATIQSAGANSSFEKDGKLTEWFPSPPQATRASIPPGAAKMIHRQRHQHHPATISTWTSPECSCQSSQISRVPTASAPPSVAHVVSQPQDPAIVPDAARRQADSSASRVAPRLGRGLINGAGSILRQVSAADFLLASTSIIISTVWPPNPSWPTPHDSSLAVEQRTTRRRRPLPPPPHARRPPTLATSTTRPSAAECTEPKRSACELLLLIVAGRRSGVAHATPVRTPARVKEKKQHRMRIGRLFLVRAVTASLALPGRRLTKIACA